MNKEFKFERYKLYLKLFKSRTESKDETNHRQVKRQVKSQSKVKLRAAKKKVKSREEPSQVNWRIKLKQVKWRVKLRVNSNKQVEIEKNAQAQFWEGFVNGLRQLQLATKEPNYEKGDKLE